MPATGTAVVTFVVAVYAATVCTCCIGKHHPCIPQLLLPTGKERFLVHRMEEAV